MKVDYEIVAIKKLFHKKTSIIYSNGFIIKFTFVSAKDKTWFDEKFALLDALITVFDECILDNNPKRALRYLCLLSENIDEICSRVEDLLIKMEKVSK